MLSYIVLALWLGAVAAQKPGLCMDQKAGYLFCGRSCDMVPGSERNFFGRCGEGVCCCDRKSACDSTENYARFCKIAFVSRSSLCQYRSRLGCDSPTTTPTRPPTKTTKSPTTRPTTTPTTRPTTRPTTTSTTRPTTETTTRVTTTTPSPTSKCGVKGNTKKRSVRDIIKRIVGGSAADKCEYPWQALLYIGTFMCGGSIIDSTTIITAAHCLVPSVDEGQIDVFVGEHNRGRADGQQLHTVQSYTVHENYNEVTIQNDIAIVKLNEPIQFDDCASPICLPSANQRFDGTNCEVSGWGTLESDGDTPNVLQTVTVPVVSESACRTAFGTTYFTDNNICAGLDNGGKDACQGDSGGPLACPTSNGYVLSGVVSWGDGCGEPGKYGVYTDVTEYLDWIAKYSEQ